MAYSDEQWDKARALFETGYSLAEIVKRSDIKDRSSISKKAKTDGWQKGGQNQQLVSEKVEKEQRLAEVNSKIQQLSTVDREVVENAVEERLKLERFFQDANMLVAKTVANKVKIEGKTATFQDLNAASSAISRAKDSVLGKQPDTVINNQNNAVAQSASIGTVSPDVIRRAYQELDAEF